jgi:hypothetical protein
MAERLAMPARSRSPVTICRESVVRLLIVLPVLLAAACSPSGEQAAQRAIDINAAAEAGRHDVANHAAAVSASPAPIASASPMQAALPPVAPPEPGTPGGLPKGGVVSEGKFTPDSAQGAADVVQTYYALLGEGRYREAHALWDDDGRASGMSVDAFVASFARYSEYHAQIGAPGRVDAGAGQRYVTVPVVLYGRLKANAAPYHASGTVTLHRVGDVDGATPAQKRWHLRDIALNP